MKQIKSILALSFVLLMAATVSAQTTYTYTLMNATTNQPVQTNINGDFPWDLDVADNLAIVSDIGTGVHTQVKFYLSTGHNQTEGAHPYTSHGDSGGNYNGWQQTAEEAVSFTVDYLNGPGNVTQTDNFTITFFRSSTSGGGGSSFPNVALNKTATQSSTYGGFSASNGVDGVTTDTNWTHTNNEANPWWRVDLGQAYDIDQIKVINRPSSCCTGRLNGAVVYVGNQDSSDPSNYTAVYNLNGDLQQDIQNLSVSGRYVMIHKTTGQGIINITEVEVHGQVSTTPSDTTPPSVPAGLASSSTTETSTSLSWNASTDDSGSIASYEVWMNSTLLANAGNTTNYSVSGLTGSTTYNFQVKAIDPSGNPSALSSALAVTTSTPSSGGGGGSTSSLWTENGSNVSYTNGNVGIGTSTTSNGTLTVTGDTFNTLRLENNTNDKEASIRFRSKNASGAFHHADLSSYHDGSKGFIGFKVPQNNAVGQGYNLVMTEEGRLGIGTTSPAKELHVMGDQILQGDNPSLIVQGNGNGDYNGGRLILKSTGINSSNTFNSAKLIMHRGTDGNGYLELQRSDNNGVFMGNIMRYNDNEGWMFLTAQNTTSTGTTVNMVINQAGNVGIGTQNVGDWKLAVDGKIRAREIRVDNDAWPDYVFALDYDLPTLDEVRNFIKKYGHLPAVPSAKEVEEEGVELGEMNKILLQKIEELTLYILELDEQVKELEKGSK